MLRRFTNYERPWTGPVERRDPSTYRRPSEVLIRICRNPYCRSWTPKRLTYCTTCHARADGSA